MSKDVIVLEFNELTPALVDRFIAAGHLPNFKRLRDRSLVGITDAGEEFPNLEPWIQWVTVHTGLSFAQHKVFHLGDGPALPERRIWDMASAAGRKVWICGSMNAAVQGETINGFVLPDPWAIDVKPHPAGVFDAYLNFVRPHVQEYTSDKPKVTKADVLAFGRFMLANGLSLKTIKTIVRQLIGERRNGDQWRRAVILDRLQWDVFRSFYTREKPALSTFFLNSTAHFQHYFWRNMDPDTFAVQSDAETQRKYSDAILYGYRKMDELIGECLAMAGPETSIVLCTALSQQPMLGFEESGGKQIFKPVDQAKLLAFAGVTQPYEYAPVMAEQFHLIFRNPADAAAAAETIAALRFDDGSPAMLVEPHDERLFCGCAVFAAIDGGATVRNAAGETRRFDALFYPVEAVRSGMHHPDGMLWLHVPGVAAGTMTRKVDLVEVAPTLLTLAGVEPAGFDRPAMAEIAAAEPARMAA